MKNSTLNKYILFFISIGVISYVFGHGDYLDEESRYLARYVFMIIFALVPFLLMQKAASSIFLSAMQGASLQKLELVHTFIYVLLTREARAEWEKEMASLKDES